MCRRGHESTLASPALELRKQFCRARVAFLSFDRSLEHVDRFDCVVLLSKRVTKIVVHVRLGDAGVCVESLQQKGSEGLLRTIQIVCPVAQHAKVTKDWNVGQ